VKIGNGEWIIGDCFDAMAKIPDGSVDMILCDLPYGTTACKWDAVLPFDKLWAEYKRVTKKNSAIVLTASQPFTSALISSNFNDFKVEWIWEKNRGSNFASAKFMPMKEHENVCVFSNGGGKTIYNPIMQERSGGGKGLIGKTIKASNTGKRETMGGFINNNDIILPEMRVPRSIQKFNTQVGLHPTQKPVALFEYLIRTYTDEDMVVLDNTAGSGTTAIAAERSGRRWICIERDEKYSAKAIARIEGETQSRLI